MDKKDIEILNNLKSRNEQIFWGYENKYVYPYPRELFDWLRPYCFGGLPLSIMLFTNELCNGHCYDRAKLMQLAFDDATVVWADIASLEGDDDGDPEHAFVETTDFGCGKTWVVDTSVGLIFDKDFYYQMEKPKVNKRISKKQCMKDPEVLDVIVHNFDEDKYLLPATLPFIEEGIKRSNHIGTFLYRDKILKEIEEFKQTIGYDDLLAEIEADMETFKRNPNELDKKFNITRDERGREISRNGVPNPYYISPEEWDKKVKEYEAIENNEEELAKYLIKLHRKVKKKAKIEYQELSKEAKVRLKEILKNPTANFYDEGQSGK